MFAKPNWFRTKSFAHGVAPASWRGWLYVVGAVGAALLPAMLLLGRGQGLEAFIWLIAAAAFIGYDLWQVRRNLLGLPTCRRQAPPTPAPAAAASPPAGDDGIYFLDQRPGAQPVNTTRFQLSLKQ